MVTIFMLTFAAGPQGSWQPGEMRQVSELEAKELIDGGYAMNASPENIRAYRLRNRNAESTEWNEE